MPPRPVARECAIRPVFTRVLGTTQYDLHRRTLVASGPRMLRVVDQPSDRLGRGACSSALRYPEIYSPTKHSPRYVAPLFRRNRQSQELFATAEESCSNS